MQVILLAAITADGFIARSLTEPSFNWTSREDKQFYVQTIKSVDAIVMGHKSFQTFSKYPKNSHWIIYTSQPEKFVNPKPQVIDAMATQVSPQELLQQLADKGYSKVAICGGASVYTMFMKSGLVDRIYLTMESVFFGSGIKLFNEATNVPVRLIKIHDLSAQTKVMEYEVVKS